MLVLVGIGEEAGWTAFAAPVLLRRFGLLGAFGVLAPLRILWHLPLVLTGEMPLVVAVVGNAGFQLIVLQLMRQRRGSWALAAVWHATLNAFGGGFFFAMVSGPDQDRLFLLLALAYALGGAVALALPRLAGERSEDQTHPAPRAEAPAAALRTRPSEQGVRVAKPPPRGEAALGMTNRRGPARQRRHTSARGELWSCGESNPGPRASNQVFSGCSL